MSEIKVVREYQENGNGVLVPDNRILPVNGARRFVNTELFSPAANHFKKHGYYTDSIADTYEWEEYWDEQKKRCEEGYMVGGMKITGYHYFYLNFCKIELVTTEDITVAGGTRKKVHRISDFPKFWDYDYDYFWTIEIAKNGISDKEYEALNLEVDILPEDRVGGRHVVVLKARGKGYSYKAGSMLARNFNLHSNSKNYAMAYDKEYLLKDGLLDKAFDTVSFVDDHTAWSQPRVIDQQMHKETGYEVKVDGVKIRRGTNNSIIGVTLNEDPEKGRGKRGELIFYEEAGKFPGLERAFEINRPSVEQGAFTFGTMIVYGTGGTKEANYEGLEELFHSPGSYNCIAISNQWDEGADGTWCGFFVPAYMNFEGFMDEDGNSLKDKAKKYVEEEREKKKESKTGKAGLDQYIAEHPFNPQEATLSVSTNILPTADILEQLNSVNVKRRYDAMNFGWLVRDQTGRVVFRPDKDAHPVFDFPLKKGNNYPGCIVVKETPFRDSTGKPPKGLYIIAHDPYAQDKSDWSKSLGSAYVFKMTNNFSLSLNDCIVASYVGRPDTQDEYNRNLFMLAEYYNALIGFENDRGDVIGYAKRHKLLHYLAEEFQFVDKRDLQSDRVNRPYGMHMTANRKLQGEMYLRDWLNTVMTTFENGTKKTILNTILDPGLLRELIKFNHSGNFDRVMSVIIGMYFQKELYNARVVPNDEEKYDVEEFFNRELFG